MSNSDSLVKIVTVNGVHRFLIDLKKLNQQNDDGFSNSINIVYRDRLEVQWIQHHGVANIPDAWNRIMLDPPSDDKDIPRQSG